MADLLIEGGAFPPADELREARLILHQGDCRDLLRAMPPGSVDLVVTSPPYNIGKPYEADLDMDVYARQQAEVVAGCARALAEGGSICWQVGNYVRQGKVIPLDILLYPLFTDHGLILRNRIVWSFGHGLHASKRFSGRYEVVLWFTKGDKYTFDLDAVRVPQKYPAKRHFKGPNKGRLSGNPLGKNPSDVWEIPNVKANHVEKTEHPCQFPIELVERLVLALTKPGDRVLDPFLGSGTTCLAALAHGRKAAGSEILPSYYAIAVERVRLAREGSLRFRPAERPVYDPSGNGQVVPPRALRLGGGQLAMAEADEALAVGEVAR